MSTKTLDRVVELWPSLSDEAQAEIVEIVEGAAAQTAGFRDLTPHEELMIEQSIEDFKQGRVLTSEEVRQHFDDYF